MKPLVYVAAPYSKPDPVENTHRAIKAGLALYDSGLVVPLIPHLSLAAHLVEPRPVDYWYALDIDQLAHCDALLRLPGASTGADREVYFASSIHRFSCGKVDIPVFYEANAVLDWAGR